MPRPALTRSRIVSAGVAVVGEIGLHALDLRTVARRVNTTATGVQRVMGMTELREAVVAQIMTTMPPVPARGDWVRRLRLWALQTRAWLTEYPGLALHLLVNRWDVPAALDRLDEVASLLGGTDLRDGQCAMAGATLYWFVLGSAELDRSARVMGGEAPPPAPGTVVPPAADGPAVCWPRLGTQVGDYSTAAVHAQFVFGLDLLLDGIDRRAGRALPPPAGPVPRGTARAAGDRVGRAVGT